MFSTLCGHAKHESDNLYHIQEIINELYYIEQSRLGRSVRQ